MAHGGYKLRDQLPRVLAHDGGTQDPVLAGHGKHLYKAKILPIGDRPIQVIQPVHRYFIGNILIDGIRLVHAHPGHFRVSEGGEGDDRIIHLEAPEHAKQGIYRGVPRLVGGGMSELIGSGHIATDIDIGKIGLQKLVGLHGVTVRQPDPQLFQSKSIGVGGTPNRHQQLIELNHPLFAIDPGDQLFSAVLQLELPGGMPDQDIDILLGEALGHQRGDIRVFADHQSRRHLHYRYPRTEAGETLSQLTADRAATQHQQTRRQFPQFPKRVGGEKWDLIDPLDRGYERPGTGGHNDIAGGQCPATHLNAVG